MKYLKEKIETGEVVYQSESEDNNNDETIKNEENKNDSLIKVNESLSMSGSIKITDSLNNVKTISEEESPKINEPEQKSIKIEGKK